MNPEEFRIHGKQLVDWIADYLQTPEIYPVLAQVKPGDIKSQLPKTPPFEPENMEVILADFNRIILPGITHWNHPGFLAYFANTASATGYSGRDADLCIERQRYALAHFPFGDRTRRSRARLDAANTRSAGFFFRRYYRFRIRFDIGRTDCRARIRTEANPLKRLAGRSDLPVLRLYCSDQAHSSIEKAGIVLGIGQSNIIHIPSDSEYRMDVHALAAAIREDEEKGYLPFAVSATVGTTATTSIDPVEEISLLCKNKKIWLHVDGAYGGSAAILPEMRYVLNGVQHADSFVVNPHKWMLTPMDCSLLFTRHVGT